MPVIEDRFARFYIAAPADVALPSLADPSVSLIGRPDWPYTRALEISPNDVTPDLIFTTRAVYVGVAGDLRCRLAEGDVDAFVTYKALAVGFHPLRVVSVVATGTTATNLVALD